MIEPVAAALRGFYRGTDPEARVCVVCDARGGAHDAACAVVELEGRVRALVAELAMYVTMTHELLEAVERLVHDEHADGGQ